jgi:NAD-dependent deacetylase
MNEPPTADDPAPFPTALLARLRRAKHVVVLTGAGVSAESGVPTFREAQTGLWARYDPHELATPEAFQRHPERVWEWYRWRQALIKDARPNRGHLALVRLVELVPTFTLVTQNVDGLHQQAGNRGVIELHGNIHRTICSVEGTHRQVGSAIDEDEGRLPRCVSCGALLRPDVVWFGEALPRTALTAAVAAVDTCDMFFSVGTSALVYPAAALPQMAAQGGAVTVEINTDRTPLSRLVDYHLHGPSGVFLPALLHAAWPGDDPNTSPAFKG